MADTTVEILNKTILWGDYTSNAQTLFTSDADTRYVMKDLQVSNSSYSTPPTVSVNGSTVASLSGSLTGTEIVDVNSTVALNFNTSVASYISVNNLLDNATKFANNVTDGAVFLAPAGFTSGAATANTPTSMSQVSNVSGCQGAWMLNGNFYYLWNDTNSQQGLYKRAGGPTGSESTIYTGSYSPNVFDGVSKFYYVQSGNFYYYDTATNSGGYLGGAGWGGSTYPFLTICNGYLFYSPSYTSYDAIAWYRISNGATGTFGTGSMSYSSYSGTVSFYDASTGTVRIMLGQMQGGGSSFYWIDIDISSGTPVYKNRTTSAINSTVGLRLNNLPSTNGNYAVVFGSSNDKIYVVDSGMNVLASKSITGMFFASNGNVGSWQFINPTNTVKNAISPSMKLRITGVKTV